MLLRPEHASFRLSYLITVSLSDRGLRMPLGKALILNHFLLSVTSSLPKILGEAAPRHETSCGLKSGRYELLLYMLPEPDGRKNPDHKPDQRAKPAKSHTKISKTHKIHHNRFLLTTNKTFAFLIFRYQKRLDIIIIPPMSQTVQADITHQKHHALITRH